MGAAGTGFPLTPTGLVAGTLTLATANTPYQLLALIQTQLDANFTGMGRSVFLQSDASGNVFIGKPNIIGALSSSNYGIELLASGSSVTVYSSFPGSNAPVGEVWVLMTVTAGTMHVFIQPS